MKFIPEHILDLKSYDPGKPIADVKEEFGLDKVIKLASNENPLGVSPIALKAMKESLHDCFRYPDIAGKRLRSKLAELHNVDISSIITAHGSEAIMSVILRTLLKEGDEVLTSEGTFIGFYVMAKALRGVNLKTVPLKNYKFDLEAIIDSISERTKIIYLVNPNNPTGNIFTREEFDNFYRNAPEDILIIMDEAYFEFVANHPDYPDSMKYRYDNVITLRTFSKAYGLAGLRVGYGFGNSDIIKNFMKVRLPFEPNIPSQIAAAAALDDHEFLRKYLDLNEKGKYFLYEVFDRLGIEYIESEANFVMSVYESKETVDKICRRMLEKGVIIRGLGAFGLPHCIRVTIGLEEENQIFATKFEETLKEL